MRHMYTCMEWLSYLINVQARKPETRASVLSSSKDSCRSALRIISHQAPNDPSSLVLSAWRRFWSAGPHQWRSQWCSGSHLETNTPSQTVRTPKGLLGKGRPAEWTPSILGQTTDSTKSQTRIILKRKNAMKVYWLHGDNVKLRPPPTPLWQEDDDTDEMSRRRDLNQIFFKRIHSWYRCAGILRTVELATGFRVSMNVE